MQQLLFSDKPLCTNETASRCIDYTGAAAGVQWARGGRGSSPATDPSRPQPPAFLSAYKRHHAQKHVKHVTPPLSTDTLNKHIKIKALPLIVTLTT